MAEFPHLPLPIKARGNHRASGGGPSKMAQTLVNQQNRRSHGRTLQQQIRTVLDEWDAAKESRMADLPNEEIVPVFLKVDADYLDIDTLSFLGIDVIAEEENGYVIGASGDYFLSLRGKIDDFIKNKTIYRNKAAQLWEVITGNSWRLDYILSAELNKKWDQLKDNDQMLVDVSIACALKIPPEPKKRSEESNRTFDIKYAQWQREKSRIDERREDLEMKRQDEFDRYLEAIRGIRVSAFVGFEDSFSCRLSLSGRALKELVLRYQYIFDVTEYDEIVYKDEETGEELIADINFEAPDENDPKVCVIDSGIHEQHLMLKDAIDIVVSKSYSVPGNVADESPNGGHGTKVAGGVIFGRIIPKTGTFKSDVWIQNAKILDNQSKLPMNLYPPQLMKDIVSDYQGTKIFNLSVNSFAPCRTKHMSEWAASIDRLMFDNDILFIISAGNVDRTYGLEARPGIHDYIKSGRIYPDFLLEPSCRIANPAQSCFAITVGSVCHNSFEDEDRKSFGVRDQVSSFSRCGLGLWGMIKPDVVEYGGDFVHEKTGDMLLSLHNSVSTEVVRSTYGGGDAIGHHVGTSFAAPKVSHIAATLLKEIPTIGSLLLRALIAQGARLPNDEFLHPTLLSLRKYGYGIVDKERTIQNTERRITLTGEGTISPKVAQIYSIRIPQEMRRPGNEYNVLIEVTLSFVARPRLTRRTTKSYLSTWIDWRSSKLGESINKFEKRMIKYIDTGLEEGPTGDEGQIIQWHIRENSDWGVIKDCKRQDSTLQKDWVVLQAYRLPEEFSIAVIGHQGWDKDIAKEVPYALAVSFEVLNEEVHLYDMIRVENEIEIEQEIITG